MTSELSAYPPRGFELRLIQPFVSLQGKRVLEIGAGGGRLTFQLAPLASSILAIDPDGPSIDEAARERESRKAGNIEFRVGSVEHLPLRGAPFDVALFSWSL